MAQANGHLRQNGHGLKRFSDDAPPPHDLDAERAVLGSLLLDPESAGRVGRLTPHDFYWTSHGDILRVIRDLQAKGAPADPVLVAERLEAHGLLADAGGPSYLAKLMEAVPLTAHADYYAQIVRDKSERRRLIYAATDLARRAGDPSEELEDIYRVGDSFGSAIGTKGEQNEFQAVPMSELGDGEPVDWVWRGWLARGFTTLFVGYPKAGKSTLLAHLLLTAGRGGELAGQIVPSRWLVVSEEHTGHWKIRRDKLAIGDHVSICAQPFTKGRPDHSQWQRLLEALADKVRTEHFDVVAIDTLGNVAPAYKTNDDNETVTMLAPLRQIVEAGAALLLVHHAGKSDVGEGKAARGSSALVGWVDTICELRRYDLSRPEDTRRRLRGLGRFDDVPAEIVVELTDEGYTTLGSTARTREADEQGVLSAILSEAGQSLTVQQVHDRHPAERPPSLKAIRQGLEAGFTAGLWPRSGAGVKNDPHRYGHDPTAKLFTDSSDEGAGGKDA